MTRTINWPAAAALLGTLALGGLAAPAQAQEYRGGWRPTYYGWTGGYYRSPPVVYGSPYRDRYYYAPRYYAPRYYRPPPVVYGPGVSFNFTIR